MSLPTATKEISDHPGKNSVTDPLQPAIMHADVDRKMRLYGVVEAFRNGKMPDNAQIDEALRYIEENSPLETDKLSQDGKRLVNDTRDIIETARLLVKEKNADELFQNFVWHTTVVDSSRAKVEGDIAPVTAEQAKADGKEAVIHLRTLLTIFLTNSEFRKLLNDLGFIGRDMFATGAAKLAEATRPSPEQMQNVDDAAPADQWRGADGQTHGPNETPSLQVTLPTGHTVTQHPKEPLGTGAVVRDADGNEMSGSEAYDRAGDRAATVTQQARGEAVTQAQDFTATVDEQAPDGDTDAQVDVGKRTLKDKLLGLKERIPQEYRDRLGDHKESAQNFFKEQFPEERRDQFVWRMKKVIVECQKHDDYQEAVNWFLNFLETYHGHGVTVANTGVKSAGAVAEDPALNQATTELRTLLERFANNASLDGVFHAVQDLYDDAQSDQALNDWFKRLDSFARRTLLEPGYVLQPRYNQDWNALRDDGKAFFDHKYSAHKDDLFDQIQAWFLAFGDDPLNKRFGEDWQRLTRDLLFDSNGDLQFKPHLWGDIRRVILPQIITQVGYVPIPRIEYTDAQIDLVIENLTLQGKNLFPNIVEIEAHNFVKFSPYSTIPDTHKHEFTLTFAQIQADMRDVAFYFKKKTGFPKLSDRGLADVVLGGQGLTVTAQIASSDKDNTSVFVVEAVHVKMDSLKFSIRDSKHDLLYKTLRPLATGLIKRQISKAIEGAIRTGLEYVDGQLVSVRDRMRDAQATEGDSRAQVLKDLFAKSEDHSKKEKASKFQVVTSKGSMFLPDAGYDKGWIQKQSERQAAAVQGETWHSKAFSVVPDASNGHA